ncbi:MAG TPA: S8 family serine peptidase [Acidimicrobiia bacterium]|nr:S8 family serine peptidase [Acidimicrobiia bacterium]
MDRVRRLRWLVPAAVAAWALPVMPTPARPAAGAVSSIVVLRPGAGIDAVLSRLGPAASSVQRYEAALTGFSADLDAAARARLAADPAVAAVVPSRAHHVAQLEGFVRDGPVIDHAVRRVGALSSPTAAIDGYDVGVDADIAVVDSGLPSGNPDLNVVGGVDCTGSGTWEDTVGHGTFVSGLAAARDDARGVVGVAPGARLWAVKVMAPDSTVTDAALLCGLDWVAGNAATVDVVNLSLGGPGFGSDCGGGRLDAVSLEHAAVCRIVASGVVAVASAGNAAADATFTTPGGFPEVITVSALTDTDGAPGGLGGPALCYPGADDTFASYSDFGAAVDIAAPGTCVESTWLSGQHAVATGTSAAAPLVSGAAALVRAVHPDWAVEQVRQWLLSTATPGPIPGDYDGLPEPVLDVAGF